MKSFLLFVSLLISANAFAQVNSVSNRITTKLGFAMTDSKGENTNLPNLRAEVNYGFARVFEVGAYIGFGFYQYVEKEQIGSRVVTSISGYAATNYGVNANFHILPLLFKEERFRFDLYLSGKVGGINARGEYSFPVLNKYFSDYGIYGGVAYYFKPHIGLYGELGWGSFTKARYGLAIKF